MPASGRSPCLANLIGLIFGLTFSSVSSWLTMFLGHFFHCEAYRFFADDDFARWREQVSAPQ